MEIIKVRFDEVIYKQIRQSKGWEEYLKKLNWEVCRTSSNILVPFLKSPLGTLNKIQRPEVFTLKDLEEIETLCAEKKAIFIKIELGISQDENLLKENNYQLSNFPLTPPSVQVFDLHVSEQALWHDISHSGKYSIKRALREGSNINYIKKPNDKQLKKFYEIQSETGKHGKFYVQPFKEVAYLRDAFDENCYILEAYDDAKNLVATKLFLAHDNVVNYSIGGTTAYGRTLKGGYNLVWQSILYFKSLGFDYLDMEGIYDERFPRFTRTWGSFTHFKEKFGGTVVQFPPPYIKLRSLFLKVVAKFQGLPL